MLGSDFCFDMSYQRPVEVVTEQLDLNDDDVDGGILNNFIAGVNWHLNPNTHIMLNYVHSQIDRNPVNGNQNTFQMRFQLDF